MSKRTTNGLAQPRLSRREALGLAAAAVLTAGISGTLYAAPARSPRFLLVFLRGGYDATNLLIPYSSSFYFETRPTIAIPRPEEGRPDGALALDADWALAPAVRDSLGKLYQQKQLAFVPFAGTDDLSRSHFETQDSIELGQPLGAARDYRSGFMARLADALAGAGRQAPSIAFTDALPLAFRGAEQIPNLSLQHIDQPFDERQAQILSGMYTGRPLQTSVQDGLALRAQVAQTFAEEMRAADRNAIGTRSFEIQAERIARLMLGSYRVGFVDVGGWDTHVNEGAGQGHLATNLAALGRGLVAFSTALGDEWRNTVVVVLSEFGRTFRENGNRGTDHGHGTVYWVLGGSVAGGRIAGEQARVAAGSLFQDRDYPVLTDYRGLLGGVFRGLWGLTAQRCEQVFPGARPLDLQLV
jgi:uncharacterized protein (DUF1501 family)